MTARATTREDFARSHVHTCQDSEYIKTAEDAWQEAIDLVNTTDGWKEEKGDKNTVRKSAVRLSVVVVIICILTGGCGGESEECQGTEDLQMQGKD